MKCHTGFDVVESTRWLHLLYNACCRHTENVVTLCIGFRYTSMEKRIAQLLTWILALMPVPLIAQGGNPAGTQRPAYSVSGAITVPPWDGQPIDPQCKKVLDCDGRPPEPTSQNKSLFARQGFDPNMEEMDGTLTKATAAHSLLVYKGFTANNLELFTPGDNSMGVSRSGFIVSADNLTIDYYGDTPDTLLQFQRHHVFYGDTLLKGVPFDPRVIYDRYTNRFIVVTCAYADSMANYLLVSFSKFEDPRLGWNHYRIRSDTLDENEWFDSPNISINRDELFITGNMFSDLGNGAVVGNKVFQIRKAEGYANQALQMKVWTDILDAEGDMAYCMVPLQDGMMRDSYNRGIYLASTKLIYSGQSSDKLFWFQITDSLTSPNLRLDTHMTSSLIPYENPQVGFQLGSTDNIRLSDAKAHSGFVMDSILNFVYCRDYLNYSVIVLNRLDLRTNTVLRYPWGYTAGSQDFSFPSIAFMGADSTDADNLAMCFLKTGSQLYPQIDVVHFDDGSFHQNSTVVRQGDGWINFYPGNQNERWGDYSTIQRRYDSQPPRAWLVGGYPNGPIANNFGVTYHLNAYIAEIGDSLALGLPGGQDDGVAVCAIFPNPTADKVTITTFEPSVAIERVTLMDLQGGAVMEVAAMNRDNVEIDLGGLASGLYFAMVQLNGKKVAYEKVVLARYR